MVMPSGAFFSNRIYYKKVNMKITQFLKETKGEMKQVTWPSRRHMFIYTLVVIVFSLALGYLLGAFDTLLKAALKSLIY
jgi:preprotein translocase SecE subunit